MYKEVKTMKKLGKKLVETKDTLEAYACLCEPSDCWRKYMTTSMTANVGVTVQNS